ncbi:hypothetical protein D3250_08050 [Nesterenkonia natronophila]|uniref:Uncharacterized protein n=1 Tax=Nesterenkonia natronophila TaxID=2174932 RepID=A0A3A4F348_9MICC|nr:hypothetical protein D3250_08050 [Nesterenkonia natronophila]
MRRGRLRRLLPPSLRRRSPPNRRGSRQTNRPTPRRRGRQSLQLPSPRAALRHVLPRGRLLRCRVRYWSA